MNDDEMLVRLCQLEEKVRENLCELAAIRRSFAEKIGKAETIPAPRKRHLTCLKKWPQCAEGEYNPSCCRWPKSCSCEIYEPPSE